MGTGRLKSRGCWDSVWRRMAKRRIYYDHDGKQALREAELLVNLVTARAIILPRLDELREMGSDGIWAADQYTPGLKAMDALIEELRSPT